MSPKVHEQRTVVRNAACYSGRQQQIDMNNILSAYFVTNRQEVNPKVNRNPKSKPKSNEYLIRIIYFFLCSLAYYLSRNICTKYKQLRTAPASLPHPKCGATFMSSCQIIVMVVVLRQTWQASKRIITFIQISVDIIEETIVVVITKLLLLLMCQQQQETKPNLQRRHELHEGICIIRLIKLKRFLEIPFPKMPIRQHQYQRRHRPQLQQQQLVHEAEYQYEQQPKQQQQQQQRYQQRPQNKSTLNERKLSRTCRTLAASESALHLSHIRQETTTTTTLSTTGKCTKAAMMNALKSSTTTPATRAAATALKMMAVTIATMLRPHSSSLSLSWLHRQTPAVGPCTMPIAYKSTQPQAATHTKSRKSFWSTLSRIPVSVTELSWLMQRTGIGYGSVSRQNCALQRTLLLLLVTSTLWHCTECFHPSFKPSTNTVKTKYGLLRGIVVRSSPLVEAYLGIPYASPPVGSLRFMPPITPSTWKNVRNADRFSPVCPQTVPIPPNGPEALLEVPRARLAQLRRLLPLLKNQSEDCLYLNIYVPYEQRQRYRRYTANSAESIESHKLATILFIHGESYEWNSGNPYDGSELAAKGNVIVVTVNFRLGIFGFLKTGGKESAQGNFGLMDLVAGLHWLKENLPVFGGDPQRITLFGYGTGAVLANILAISPVASDLVQRAVLVSGSALSPWAIQKNPLFVKRRVAEQTGCHGDMLYDDLAPCLRTKSVTELLAVNVDHPRFLVGFAPFVDGTVISPNTDSIGTITLPMGSAIVSTSGIEYANFPKRDLIFCLTSVESYLDLSAQDLEFGFNDTRRDRILRTFVRNNFHYHLNEIFAVLKNEYTDWEKAIRNPLSSRDATLSFLSDGHTASSLVKLGYMHSLRGGRTYFLHFKHRTVEEEYPQRKGSVHGEDVPFWLGLPISPLFPHNYTTQEKQISRLLLRYLTNFAKTGNPNQSTSTMSTSLSMSTSDAVAHQQIKRDINVLNSTEANAKALNLAVLYNQRRSNRMHEKRALYRRRLRSNDVELNLERDEQDIGSYSAEKMPFWDAYDVVNQLYLELGNKANIQSHYRGHKLSMWLNLIPQLHRHFNINDQSMRHHQFQDDMNSRDLYEGAVRPQLQIKPTDDEDTIMIQSPKATTSPAIEPRTNANKTNTLLPMTAVAITTECDNEGVLYMSELATTQSPKDNRSLHETQKDLATASTGLIGNLEVLRRLGGKQFQSYTTALIATVSVGCFLLLLNVLIFAGIYHQREKRARDAKTKEELQDSDTSKNSSMLKLNALGDANVGSKSSMLFGEYNCYDEKTKRLKSEKILIDLPPPQSTVLLDNAGNWTTAAACSTSTLDLLKTKQHAGYTVGAGAVGGVGGIEANDAHTMPPTFNHLEMVSYNTIPITAVMEATTGTESAPQSKRGSFMGTSSSITHGGQFDYAVQSSDQMSFKEIEEAVKAAAVDVDMTRDDDIPEPPPPPRSYHHTIQKQMQQQKQHPQTSGGGILRQTNVSGSVAPVTTGGTVSGSGPVGGAGNGSNKKRVHIQEISV